MCVIMRRVRKLAYMKKLAPATTGDLPEIPDWGGKLRIQAEMEVTKCVASAILLHKMRENEKSRTPEVALGVVPSSNAKALAQPWGEASTGSQPQHREVDRQGKKRHQRLAGKTDAEVNLINELWGDPSFSGITQESPPGTRRRSPSPPERSKAGERASKDLFNYLEREYIRDVASANQFIEQSQDNLFTAARAASLGGAGSLAVLLQTLQSQVSLVCTKCVGRRCSRNYTKANSLLRCRRTMAHWSQKAR